MALAVSLLSPVAGRGQGSPTARPTLGFSLQIETSGLLNPTIDRATVKGVIAGSPAEKGGLSNGDELLAIDGVSLPGAEASRVRALLSFTPGTSRLLTLRRPDGARYETTLGP
jgi:C-terminal processing protease CtpA/Prc